MKTKGAIITVGEFQELLETVSVGVRDLPIRVWVDSEGFAVDIKSVEIDGDTIYINTDVMEVRKNIIKKLKEI